METLKIIIKKIFWCFHDLNLYKIVSLIGICFRLIFLPMIIPDFFELIFPFIISWNMPELAYEIVLRLFLFLIDILGLTHIYYLLSYGSTGLYYERGSAPALGSAFYTFFYFVYSLIPVLLIQFFYWWVILVIFVVYVILCFVLFCISFGSGCGHEKWIVNIIAHGIITFVVFLALLLICIFCA